ncbi:activator of 90 kDa heat shock protein ATPase homolog 1-like [Oscarella lobularis]|uniref:activator of 90 kDa heat shock protein ATPase homolog 1-like n=1 Tax=Oscarella lobularis TaxID=121494 RepID=UPI0033138A0B
MAKWGEGDPRWIVEERRDAQNVNNWHWTERDATDWSKKELKRLLQGIKVEGIEGKCETTDLSKIEGEASVNNRKAKLISFYEWHAVIEWKGTVAGDDDDLPIRGTIEIPNFSEEYDADELEIVVKLTKSSDENCGGDKLKQLMRTKGATLIRKAIDFYIQNLRTEFSKGMLLPRHTSVEESPSGDVPPSKETNASSFKNGSSSPSQPATSRPPVKTKTKKLFLSEEFKTSADELYETFVDKQRIEAFTNGPADVLAERGGKFSLYGGNIRGTFSELVPNKKLSLNWRLKEWPDGHYSKVVLDFEQTSDSTVLKMSQSGVPDFDLDRTERGWKEKYWRAIKMTFGFGASLF